MIRAVLGPSRGSHRLAAGMTAVAMALVVAHAAALCADFSVDVDARDAARRILHVQQRFDAKAGPVSLSYPKWIPGEHGPTGPVTDVAGLVLRAGGRTLPWRRDPIDMFTIHFDVPEGAASVELAFDFLLDGSPKGFTSAAASTENLLLLSWNEVSMYPSGRRSDDLTCEASVRLPAGWQLATALETRSKDAGLVRFEPCSYTVLVDSPVLAGRYFRVVDLSMDRSIPIRLDMAADSEDALAITGAEIDSLRRLVREADALYGTRHFPHYDFLLTLSDQTAHFGLEHHLSSDDRVSERTWIDEDLRRSHSNLLAHEFSHSRNGKYRRPTGLATPDYGAPMQGDLLWVYEGLTQYLGFVLAARSGLRTPEEAREVLALLAADLEATRGRTWRPLADTAVEAQLLYDARDAWRRWRRGTDFYDEGLLVWLEADVTIRRRSNGRRSLDDVCRRFLAGANGSQVKTYDREDVLQALDAVEPYDWRAFLHDRIDVIQPHPPLGGVQSAGWRLGWTETMGPMHKAREEARKSLDESGSIGVEVDKETGTIQDVVPGSAADRAGVAPEMKLIGVNGRRWNKDVLRDAIADSRQTGTVRLLLENQEFFRDAKLEYDGGRRYPQLVRTGSDRDWLADILAPRAKPAGRGR